MIRAVHRVVRIQKDGRTRRERKEKQYEDESMDGSVIVRAGSRVLLVQKQ